MGRSSVTPAPDVKELPPDMSETGDFLDIAAPIKFFETGITVGMQIVVHWVVARKRKASPSSLVVQNVNGLERQSNTA